MADFGIGETAAATTAAEVGKGAAEAGAGAGALGAAGTGAGAAGLGSGWIASELPLFAVDSSLALGAGTGAGAAGTGAGAGALGSGWLSSMPASAVDASLAPGAAGAAGTGMGSTLGGIGSSLAKYSLPLSLGMNALRGIKGVPGEDEMRALAGNQAESARLANEMGAGQYQTYKTGLLPQSTENELKKYDSQQEAEVRRRYAQMGLSGSSMEAADLAKVRTTVATMRDTARQLSFDRALKALGGGGAGNAGQVYSQMANMNLNKDTQLQGALGNLALMAAMMYGRS